MHLLWPVLLYYSLQLYFKYSTVKQHIQNNNLQYLYAVQKN